MASSDESVADSDEEMICCHVCLLRFNTVERKPKFLDCHHFFCLRCVRGFSKGNSIPCPTCRHVTNMTGREIEDLSTNNIVLRLVTIALDRAREVAEREKKKKDKSSPKVNQSVQNNKETLPKLWCVECSVLTTPACARQKHMMCDYAEMLSQNMDVIQSRAKKCCQTWDLAIEDRQKVHQVYGDILESLRCLQAEIMNRVEVNDSNIALMESKKLDSRYEVSAPPNSMASGNDIISTMHHIHKTIAQLDNWDNDASRNQFTAQRLLQNLNTIEENNIQVTFSNVRSDRVPLRSIELLKNLQLSFSGARQNEPVVKACVSVISFLILRLAEEQAKPGSSSSSSSATIKGDNQMHAENIETIRNEVRKFQLEEEINTDADNESSDDAKANVIAVASPNKKMTFRDKVLLEPKKESPAKIIPTKATPAKVNKPTDEWQTVVKPSRHPQPAAAHVKNCFFRLTIDNVPTDRIVFQLEPALAPIMSAKFVEMCNSKTGYQGSRIFKNMKGESVMGGSRWFHTKVYPPEEENRKDLFQADRSDVKEKRGSIRFQMKSMANGFATVSTEFQIILVNRPSYHYFTTCFAHVIEGLSVWDKVSEINLKECRVMIAECGSC